MLDCRLLADLAVLPLSGLRDNYSDVVSEALAPNLVGEPDVGWAVLRRWAILVVVPCWLAAGFITAGSAQAAVAPGNYTAAHLRSQPGDLIGRGLNFDLTGPPASVAVTGGPGYAYVSINTGTSDGAFVAEFYAPQGQDFQVGQTYTDVTRPHESTGPWMVVVSDRDTCGSVTGQFTVKEVALDATGALTRLALSFIQHCNGAGPALLGWISFHAANPYAPSDMTLTGPSTAPRTVPLGLAGTLTYAGLPVAAVALGVTRSDLGGSHVLADVTTGADGGFSVGDSPPLGGPVTYTVTFAGDSDHSPAAATFTVQVARAATALTISVNGKVFIYGGLATVSIHLGPTGSSRQIELWEYVYGVESPHLMLVYRGNVNSAGNYGFSSHMYRHISFLVKFLGDGYSAPAQASSYTTALARITTTLNGAYRLSGSYHYYHRTVNPQIVAVISPPRGHVGSFYVTAQSYSGGLWRTFTTSAAQPISDQSNAIVYLVGNHAAGIPIRVRTYTVSDTVNAASTSAWAYLEFTA